MNEKPVFILSFGTSGCRRRVFIEITVFSKTQPPIIRATPQLGVPRLTQTDRTEVPKGLDVHLVLDNYATHMTVEENRWLENRANWHLHFSA